MNPHLQYYQIGDTASFSKTISEYDCYAFAGITGDFYGVHVNEEHARKTRFKTRIAHGAMLIGFLGTLMGRMADKAPPPGAVSYRYDVKFKAPVFFGDTITFRLDLVEKREERSECVFDATCSNQRGEVVAGGQTILKVLKAE
jgi:3-hydroxybutyryl-CoA dehydratase